MKDIKRNSAIAFSVMFIIILLSAPVFSWESVTIIGTINTAYQIVTENDQIYEIGDNETGDELVSLTDKTVRVSGRVVEDDDGNKVFMATSYEVLDE